MQRSQVNQAGTVLQQAFKILAETAIAAQPSKGSFDDPAHRQQDKALGTAWSQRDLQVDAPLVLNPEGKLIAIVATIGQNFLQALPQAVRNLSQHQFWAVSFADIGRMNDDFQQVAQ